ncbi:hypothetical protein [Gorillibacterium sp. CAU 1737]|uniref:hypothetical protein n=1 Tax=Gorillibacterium sp. CAU 1737 TaxID=3140362 RepID=UPI003261ABBD
MTKKWLFSVFTVLLLLSLTACGQNKTAYDTLKHGSTKLAEANSFDFSGSLAMKISDKSLQEESETALAVPLPTDLELKFSGVQYTKEKKGNVNLEVGIKGDMAFTLTIPMVYAEDTFYVKIPQTPLLPLPDTLAGKYVAITKDELQSLAESTGEVDTQETLDEATQEKLNKELEGVIAKHFKDDSNLVKVSVKKSSAEVPENVKEVVEYSVTNDTFPKIVEKLVKEVLPEVIAILGKEQYRAASGVDPAMLGQFQTAVDGFTTDELQKSLTVNKAIAQFGLDKSGYLAYLRQNYDVTAKDEQGEAAQVAFDLSFNATDINKTKTEVTVPGKEETISFTELQEQIGAAFMGSMDLE